MRALRALRLVTAGAAALAAVGVGCASLLGLDDVTYAPRDAAGSADAEPDRARMDQDASCDGCHPVTVIAEGLDCPHGIAVTSTHVYFGVACGAEAGLARCPLTGCGDAAPELVKRVDAPRVLATNETSVFVGGGLSGQGKDYVFRCPTAAACEDAGALVAGDMAAVNRMVMRDGVLYFTHESGGSGFVSACSPPWDGCGTDSGTSGPFNNARGLAVGSDAVFFATGSLTFPVIRKCPLAGLAACDWDASVFVEPRPLPVVDSMATSADGRVLWVNTVANAIEVCPFGGCPLQGPTLLVQNATGIQSLTVDRTSVYFTSYRSGTRGEGRIGSCSLTAGCITPTFLVDGQDQPSSVTVDDTRVYWVDEGFTQSGLGRVMSVLK
jgi:hypothetical protein